MSHNRLAEETSPYLLQHADNPVHWWAWGPSAFAEAKRTGRPVLLSVGYAACHWCHVMAHESFEDDDTAKLMNMLFVNIKVDREERPEVDALYMAGLHALGEQGGWPLTMFLDEAGAAFWGGTYFPKQPALGRPSFSHVLREIARIYADERGKVESNAAALRQALTPAKAAEGAPVDAEFLARLAEKMPGVLDAEHGGLSGAPKFPNLSVFALLWRLGLAFDAKPARDGVLALLQAISQGGIYDHLGGGLARYTVDRHWLVPHFEKMLYDNAQFLDLATEVWRETRDPLLAMRIAETAEFLMRDMAAPEGGFAASWDADSEGHEGKFYVWSRAEIDAVLGADDGARFAAAYDVTATGNWEGANILNRLHAKASVGAEEAALAPLRAKLLTVREERVKPGFDDKVLADWNGLTIAGLAKASAVFGRLDWLNAARAAFRFITERMGDGDRLRHSFRAGRAGVTGLATDYANMIAAALALHQAGDAGALALAQRWAATLEAHHAGPDGAYFLAADDAADVPMRLRGGGDDAVPNANATMLGNLAALATLTGDETYRARAMKLQAAFAAEVRARPIAFCGIVAGAMDAGAPLEIAIAGIGPEADALARAAAMLSLPGAVIVRVSAQAAADPSSPGFGKGEREGRAAAYVCSGPQCSAPITAADALTEALLEARGTAWRVAPPPAAF